MQVFTLFPVEQFASMTPEGSSARIETEHAQRSRSVAATPDRLAARSAWSFVPSNPYDALTCAVLATLAIAAWLTFRDYAISNDEGVQHHYGQLIIDYYRSGFSNRDLFAYENLYLYGGLFDVIAVSLAKVVPIEPFELRHILCALIGIGGIAASAATARLIAGPRAGLITAVALALCGAWYGAMFNHTKDIPFAAAMAGATLFLLRIARQLPSPRAIDVAAFGLFAGASLGVRSLGLLLFLYPGLAILIYLPWREHGARLRFAGMAALKMFPALVLAYLMMILAWPWAALSPLNPVRGLFAFSEFHYAIRTVFEGRVYEMGEVPRLYVPVYLLIRVPLVTLFGAALALISMFASFAQGRTQQRREIALVFAVLIIPLSCQVALHGPAFTGMRHFLFVLPPLAALAGVGFDGVLDRLARQGRWLASSTAAVMCTFFLWDGATLVRLHPYENLSYNALVGGLPGAYRRYDMDYWFNSMPEAIHRLEAYLREKTPLETSQAPKIYSVAVCGIQLSFDRTVTLPQLHWDFRSEWDESEFFIAPTHMNCDRDLDGDVVATVERFGVPIAYVKDRRAIVKLPVATVASPLSAPDANRKEN
jgi:hypothetical protein